MKKHLLIAAALSCLLTFGTGCVKTASGDLKAGVPFKKDNITSLYERPIEQIFSAAKQVLAENGVLNREDTINKTLEAKVDTRTVYVKVEDAGNNISRIITQVRTKGGGADIDLASEIDKQIALRLR